MAVVDNGSFIGSVSLGPGATLTATASRAVAVGERLFIGIGFDNLTATTPTVSSITDPRGNSYTQVTESDSNSASSGGGVRVAVWTCAVTTQIESGDTITIAFSSASTARTSCLGRGFSGLSGTVTSIDTDRGSSPVALTTSPDAAGDVVFGFVTCESSTTLTGDADTTDGSWSTADVIRTTGSGGAAANVSSLQQHKIVTGTTAQSWLISTVNDWSAVLFSVAAVAGATVNGTINTALGALTATAAGGPTEAGTINTALGALTATAIGTPKVLGAIATGFGSLTATATGTPKVLGSINTSFGSLTATAVGLPTVKGAIATTFGSLTATASGGTAGGAVNGTIATTFGSLTATAAGTPTAPGTISQSLGALTATASGTPTVFGSVTSTFGALTATGLGDGAVVVVPPEAPVTTSGRLNQWHHPKYPSNVRATSHATFGFRATVRGTVDPTPRLVRERRRVLRRQHMEESTLRSLGIL